MSANGASSYTWNPGGVGSTIVVSPTVATTYTVIGTSVNGCTNTSVFTQSVSLCNSINQQEHINAEIYPNPTSGIVSINLAEEKSGVIELYNIIGEEIFSNSFLNKGSIELNIAEFSNGIYFIKVTGVTKKIVKID